MRRNATEAEYLSVQRTAVLIDACERTVRRYIAQGDDPLPAIKLGDGKQAPVRIPRRELLAWLERRRVTVSPRTIIDEVVGRVLA